MENNQPATATILKNRLLSQSGARERVHLLRLLAPKAARAARPGQFVMLKVRGGDDPILARPFSVHNTQDDELHLLYRVAGRGTAILGQAPENAELGMWGPLGRGFELAAGRALLVAGGMGWAPLRLLARRLEDQGATVEHIVGADSAGSLHALLHHLPSLERHKRLHLASEDGSAGLKGLVTDLMSDFLPHTDMVYTCGPIPMLKAVARMCGQAGVACQVSLESPMACGVGACQGCVLPAVGGAYLRVCQEGPVLPANLVDWKRI